MGPPFRADQIGSLLRPPSLLKARESTSSPSNMYTAASNANKSDEVKRAECQAVQDAVSKQVELSIRPIVSGEYGRYIFYGGFFETLEGMEPQPELPIPQAFRTDFPTTEGLRALGAKTRAAVVAKGKIEWKRSAYLEEWEMLKACVTEEKLRGCKVTMPAPTYQHIQLKPGTAFTSSSGYESDDEYFRDMGKAYAAEIKALYDAGCRYIQIDDPNLTYFCSTRFLEGCKKDGTDTDALLDLYLEAHNYCLKDKPNDMRIGMHLCRGNMGSTHFVGGSYEKIAKKMFETTKYDTFFLEFDDGERQGGFEPLRHLPEEKNIVLGLVSTKKAEMEDKEMVKEKIMKAAEAVAKGQGIRVEDALGCLAVSPQCGFSSLSTSTGKDFTMEKMWQKLELVRDIAREVWSDAL